MDLHLKSFFFLRLSFLEEMEEGSELSLSEDEVSDMIYWIYIYLKK